MKKFALLAFTLLGELQAEKLIETQTLFIHLQGIALVDKPLTSQMEKGISLHGTQIPALDELKATLEEKFLRKGILSHQIPEVEATIKAHLKQHGVEWALVMVPEQELAQGVLQVVVVQGVVGNITCRGNKWFSDETFTNNISVQKGEVLDSTALLNDIAWMNRNPFRQTNIALRSGKDPLDVDIELITRDRIPLRFYVGADNTGSTLTGRARGFTGVTWGDFFQLDHRLTYQYTTDSELKRFQAHTFQYLAPLLCRHQLFIYGGLSWIRPDIKPLHSDGNSSQASLRYTIPFNPLYTGLLNEFTWGFDFKRTNNDFFYLANEFSIRTFIPIFTHEVNLTQGMLGYSFAKQYPHHRAKFDFEMYFSPASWVPGQSHRDYEQLRPGSKPQYIYGKFAFGNLWNLPASCGLNFLSRVQLASANLLPSEQFGLGGYDTVRGYQERQVNVDNALCLNLEFHSPKWKVLGNMWKVQDEFMLLAFIDYGFGKNCNLLSGEHLNNYLIGIGPGLRYSIGPYFSARLDYGFPLHKTQFQQQMKPQLHVGVTASY